MKLVKKNLIVYELNEVPKKVLDYYLSKRPRSNLASLCKSGIFRETVTNDSGELHPWSTWPSVHRGVTNDKHSINFLNQDKSCARLYPPIWEVLEKSGISIGIFGSLQTYPPYSNKNVDFFVPDTFSPCSSSIPHDLELFQRFNLSLARRNKAFAGGIKFIDILNFLKIIIKGLISKKTIIRVFSHIIKECWDARYKKRRCNIQAILAFDAYKKFLKKSQPLYSTFFTNHIASNMHRYWLHTFPEDFDKNVQNNIKDANFNSSSILKAMDIADRQIGFLMKFQKLRGGSLWVVSGFGQQAISREEFEYELYLNNTNKFIDAFKLDKKNYEFIPAMFPDINIKCKDQESLKLLLKNVTNLKDFKGHKILKQRYQNKGNTLNLVIELKTPFKKGNDLFINEKSYKLSEIGFKLISRDNGTGYHIKEGIFITNNNYKKENNTSLLKNYSQLDICNLFKMTLEYFDIK